MNGWVFYDGTCAICKGGVKRFGFLMRRAKFECADMQEEWVKEKMNITNIEDIDEMRILTKDGVMIEGVDGILHVAKYVWWTWPMWFLSKIPPIGWLMKVVYRNVAQNRHKF